MAENKVNGNIEGIKNTVLEQLKTLYDMRQEQLVFASPELVHAMAALTGIFHREVMVYIARDGRIVDVSVGDSGKVNMQSMRLVRNEDRLCGVRCIHTHPNGNPALSGVDRGTLRSMQLDSMASIGVDEAGGATGLCAAYLGELGESERQVLTCGPFHPYKLPQEALIREIYLADDRLKCSTREVEESQPERAVLIGLENKEDYDTMAELAELAKTAGAQVVGRITQKRNGVDNATYVGSGKAEELSLAASELMADLFIVDDELTPVQARNLEQVTGVRVIDRTALILDIFAERATSREGKLQVELAQQKYRLPRLIGQGGALSRQGGGIGARGPGEKKLEIDRRRIKARIGELERELKEIEKQRGLRRIKREKNPVPLVALVGYTNVGKSTLLNALTNAGVMAEDKLFATLDPVVRQAELPGGTQILLSDTVGFINKLPHDLVEAFRSTLEEVKNADLILHVIDISSPYYESQKKVVEEVIASLGATETPRIDVYNKCDKSNVPTLGEGVFISAKTRAGFEALFEKMEKALSGSRVELDLCVPYNKYEAMSLLREEARILTESHEAEGVRVRVQMDESTLWKLKKIMGA